MWDMTLGVHAQGQHCLLAQAQHRLRVLVWPHRSPSTGGSKALSGRFDVKMQPAWCRPVDTEPCVDYSCVSTKHPPLTTMRMLSLTDRRDRDRRAEQVAAGFSKIRMSQATRSNTALFGADSAGRSSGRFRVAHNIRRRTELITVSRPSFAVAISLRKPP